MTIKYKDRKKTLQKNYLDLSMIMNYNCKKYVFLK